MASSNQLVDHIAQTLRSRILRGEYRPGMKLSENMISHEFSCSRTPVREVLKLLARDGIVEILPHSGTYVKTFTEDEDIQIAEVRCYLESLSFRLAAERHADVTALKAIAEQLEILLSTEEVDCQSYGKTHFLFHKHLVELSGNPVLLDVYSRLNLCIATKLIYREIDKAGLIQANDEHSSIVKALEDGDIDRGEKLIFAHLWRKRENLRDSS